LELSLSEISSFYVGGRVSNVEGRETFSIQLPQQRKPFLVDPNGEFDIEQVYVQAFKLTCPSKPHAVVLMHGGGLTGSVWESLADGAPGWLSRILREGYNVYVADSVGMGRSSWDAAQGVSHPALPRSKREAWELFRIGPQGTYSAIEDDRASYTGSQFPIRFFDEFTKRIVPRWSGTEAAATKAYCELLERIGPCFIIAHSSASGLAYQAAARHRNLVRGLCLIEPSLYPEGQELQSQLENVHMLHLFGDFIDSDPAWCELRSQVHEYSSSVTTGTQKFVDLPKVGICGNTHCMMADANADVLIKIITEWMDSVAV
jgi:pimeloyl-ACP methyl ester carboxylesterase